ncbi:hypothetical protein AXG93_1054s1100 [Marchantia polymorpha subsp. ruderalis]|uniref:HTH CENPB-type domain-containing protein n=1 Tax=Marchantia polymorpha subsp. ruderalis TaxID=1480154 RepID=A0A176WPV4_MARPO|nr:hypothetical protein AXG93_1054s1100 [Marchantia polymorpha subsp. ruderalis]
MRRANLPVPLSLAIAKAKSIAVSLSILKIDFKASRQWLRRFRQRRGLQKMLLHEEGVEVNKTDPQLLAALDELYVTIVHYEPETFTIWTRQYFFSVSCKAFANDEENQEDVNKDETITSQVTDGELGNSFVFSGLESLYKQVVDIEDHLMCSKVQVEAE